MFMPATPPAAPQTVPIAMAGQIEPRLMLLEKLQPQSAKTTVYIMPQAAPKNIPLLSKCLPAVKPEKKVPNAVTIFATTETAVSENA